MTLAGYKAGPVNRALWLLMARKACLPFALAVAKPPPFKSHSFFLLQKLRVNVAITIMQLRLLNMDKKIPKGTVVLTFLSLLSMCSTSLAGSIPNALGSLQRWQVLDARQNSLKGQISVPVISVSLRRMSSLRIDNNDFKGPIPDAVAMLEQLEILTAGSWVCRKAG